MISPDSHYGSPSGDLDVSWRLAEELIERLDRRSRQPDAGSGFEMELAESLRRFSSASGVLIRKRSESETVPIAKSGISVFQIDSLPANGADRSGEQDNFKEKRLVVTRPLSSSCDLEIQLCFEQRPTEQQERLFIDTAQALSDILLPVVLRHEISSLSQALQSISADQQFVESFYVGATATETYRSIARTLATLTQSDRVSIVRRSGPGNSTRRLAATSVPADIDPRAEQARLLGQLVQSSDLQSQYSERFGVSQLHVAEVVDQKQQVQAWVVFEQYSETATGNSVGRTDGENTDPSHQLSSLSTRFAPFQDLTFRAIQSVVVRDLATPDSIRKAFTRFLSLHWLKVAAAVGVIFLALWFVQIPMRLSVPGRIAAASRITKYSPTHGFVTKVLVSDGDRVTSETVLVELHSPELERVAQRLSSELATTTTKIDTLQSAKRDAAASQATAQLMVLKTEADGIRRQLELVRQEQASLVLRSDQDGIVRQWDAKETLAGRVVVIGQPLLEIIDPTAGWTVELEIPDALIGYVTRQHVVHPSCTFRLLSSPTQVHQGLIDQIDRAAQLNKAGKSIVRATVPFTTDQAVGFRRGASVIAKVDCGHRPAGFVLFRGLVQWWRSQQWL